MKRLVCNIVILLAGALAFPAMAEVTLSPETIDLGDLKQTAEVRVLRDGQPVPAGDIGKMVTGVFKTGEAVPERKAGGTHFSNYSHMFNFAVKADGLVTITPVENALQIGKYDFYVYTAHGTAKGVIDAHLRVSIPPRPPRDSGRAMFQVKLNLSEYVYGQAISIDLGSRKLRDYTWYIDGEVHASGQGLSSFRAWPEPGEHEISFVAKNAACDVVSEGSGIAVVKEEAAIMKSVSKGDKLTFVCPHGYTDVAWRLNGKVVAENAVPRDQKDQHTIKFKKKGAQTVSCRASGGENENFRQVTWQVSVH